MKKKITHKVARSTLKRRNKTLGKPTLVSKDFRPGRPKQIGADERHHLFGSEAHYLRRRGWSFDEIGAEIAKRHNLVKIPDKSQVYKWVQWVQAQNVQTFKEAQAEYIELVKDRAELIIKKLIPLALDEFVFERMKMIDGQPTPVIDENVLKERVAAAAEIRKQHETVLKAMGITKPQESGEKHSPESVKMFIIQTITNHIARKDEVVEEDRKHTVLELRAGDPIIDGL